MAKSREAKMFRRTVGVNFTRNGFETFSVDASLSVAAVAVGSASVLGSDAESVEADLSVETVYIRRARTRRNALPAPAAEALLAVVVVSDEQCQAKLQVDIYYLSSLLHLSRYFFHWIIAS